MSAKILAFDPNRKVPPRHYTPIAMRGRLLHMPSRAIRKNLELSTESRPQLVHGHPDSGSAAGVTR
jgi:hypothetical protein